MPKKTDDLLAVETTAEGVIGETTTLIEPTEATEPTEPVEVNTEEPVKKTTGRKAKKEDEPTEDEEIVGAELSLDDGDEQTSEDVLEIPDEDNLDEDDEDDDAPSSKKSTPATRRGRRTTLTMDIGDRVRTERQIEDTVWHELKNSHIRGSYLRGIFYALEQPINGAKVCVIDYEGQRVAIPLKEMGINVRRYDRDTDVDHQNRLAQLLNGMLGAEVEFVVTGLNEKERACVASRSKAMMRMRRSYYNLTNRDGSPRQPQIYPGRIVQAPIIAVGERSIWVSIFGVDVNILSDNLAWEQIYDVRKKYSVGDRVRVRVLEVNGVDNLSRLTVAADIKSLYRDPTVKALARIREGIAGNGQMTLIGTVSGESKGIVFLNLMGGARAVSHMCLDKRLPGIGDTVRFTAQFVNEERRSVSGVITTIIKRNI